MCFVANVPVMMKQSNISHLIWNEEAVCHGYRICHTWKKLIAVLGSLGKILESLLPKQKGRGGDMQFSMIKV